MSRIKLLQSNEIKDFDTPIIFNITQKQYNFSFSDDLDIELEKLRHPCSKIGMVLQWGYFKYHGRFFELNKFRQEDIDFVTKFLNLKSKYFDFKENYNLQMAYDHRKRILALTKWK